MPERREDSRKGENGKVAVIGGSKDYTGAPALSAEAALRTGTDLVKILTSEEVSDIVASYSENLIVDEYNSGYLGSESVGKALKKLEWCDTAVIGPGLGEPKEETVIEVIANSDSPLVIDADAIEPALKTEVSGCIFTPHRNEVEPIEEAYGSISSFAQETSNVVLLKGPTDQIYSEKDVREVKTGHPGMTVGGTGDVLTGIIAGLLSQGIGLEDAAVKAAKLNGLAGEKAAEEYGGGLLATDLVEMIPEVIEDIE